MDKKTYSQVEQLFNRLLEILPQKELAARIGKSPKTIGRWKKRKAALDPVLIPAFRDILSGTGSSLTEEASFKFIDLFAGIGGMRKAFESAGGKCVYTCEWNSYCHTTYLANFNVDHEIDGDITKVNKNAIPDHDVLVAGFPCQPFSIAGVSKKNSLGRKHGFDDETQGNLFFDICDVLQTKKPAAFLLENVKNLVSHDGGDTFRTITRILTEGDRSRGYNFRYNLVHTTGIQQELPFGGNTHGSRNPYKIIDAKSFVPQHRERTFIVGFLDNHDFTWEDVSIPPVDQGPKLGSILHTEDGNEEEEPHFTHGADAAVSGKYTLSSKLWRYLRDYAEKHRLKGNGFGYGLFGRDQIARTLSARYYKDGSEILIKRGRGNPRRLTPRECARLMGFDGPEDRNGTRWKIPVSDTRAYQQFGNAVVVPVVEAIAKPISELLRS